MKLACKMLGWLCLSCFGHNLDIAINKGLNDHHIDQVLSLCRKVVSAFSYSWKRKHNLKVVQEQKDLPTKMLKGDVSTRWRSKCDIIVRILQQQDTMCWLKIVKCHIWFLVDKISMFYSLLLQLSNLFNR